MDLQANSERFEGFADVYDRARPRLPRSVVDIVCAYVGPRGAELRTLVDLGSGTGLSARPWALAHPRARVVCVDPCADMLGQARRSAADVPSSSPSPQPLEFVRAFAHETGLPAGVADVVQVSQAFHWMEPSATLAEAARLLRSGGVLAVVDCAWPPVIPGCWRSERAFERVQQAGDRLSAERGLTDRVRRWDKRGHADSLRTKAPAGAFEWVRQVLLHAEDEGDAARLVALAESQGGVQTALKGGATREELGLTDLERTAREEMGEGASRWLWGYTVLLALRA
eukprot:m51a1_g5805 hypothetical protein (284) ;mRNA; r:135959-136915